MEQELEYPNYLNPLVINLLQRLLNKDQSQRWAYRDISLIKSHPWCRDIQWDRLISKQAPPPWLPNLETSNFDPEYTTLPLDFSELDT